MKNTMLLHTLCRMYKVSTMLPRKSTPTHNLTKSLSIYFKNSGRPDVQKTLYLLKKNNENEKLTVSCSISCVQQLQYSNGRKLDSSNHHVNCSNLQASSIKSWKNETCHSLPNSSLKLSAFKENLYFLQSRSFVRGFHMSCSQCAGHSKWANIKHTKAAKDQEKSAIFTKLGSKMRLAKEEGGPDPATNRALANLIEQAKSKGMTKASIDRALTKKVHDPSTEQVLEIRGPNNSCILAVVLTEGLKRTRNSVGKILNAHNATYGSSLYAFKKKGIVEVPGIAEGREALSLDEATELAIEVDAEDVEEEENEDGTTTIKFICDPSQVNIVKEKLKKTPFVPDLASESYLVDIPMELSESDMDKAADLIEAIQAHQDVIAVHDNISE